MKRVGSFLLAAILAVLWIPAAAAATVPMLSISSGEVSAGGDVTLTVSLTDNPGLAATLIYIYYDTSVFTVSPDGDLSAAGSFRSSGGLIGNSIATAKANGRYSGDADKDGVLALWYNGSGRNTTGSGSLLTVTLHADKAAANGTYAVELGYSGDDTCNESGENVILRTSNGAVTVTGGTTGGNASSGSSQITGSQTTGSQTTGNTTTENQTETAQTGSEPTQTDTVTTGSSAAGSGAAGSAAATTGTAVGNAVPSTGSASSGQTAAETSLPTEETAEEPVTAEAAAVTFTDVSGNWAESYIQKAASLGLVQGYNGLYRPDDSMTRAELVTILWRASGSPAATAAADFTDLTQSWYLDAVAWAQETGIVNGVGHGRFSPNGTVTREQLVTIMHRLAGTPTGLESMLTGVYDSQYSDSGDVSSWAKAALYWSVYSEIYCGEASTSVGQTLAPAAAASRAQIAVMMVRYLEHE